jgi:hypothetical protein
MADAPHSTATRASNALAMQQTLTRVRADIKNFSG